MLRNYVCSYIRLPVKMRLHKLVKPLSMLILNGLKVLHFFELEGCASFEIHKVALDQQKYNKKKKSNRNYLDFD